MIVTVKTMETRCILCIYLENGIVFLFDKLKLTYFKLFNWCCPGT